MEPRRLLQLLREHGFQQVSQRGSHVKLRDAQGRTVVVPFHAGRPVKVGLLKALLAEAGIPEDRIRG